MILIHNIRKEVSLNMWINILVLDKTSLLYGLCKIENIEPCKECCTFTTYWIILFHSFTILYLFFFVCSSIHDHADAHCFLKVLDGRLKETQYPWPSESEHEKPLEPTASRFYETNEVNYINGMSKPMIFHWSIAIPYCSLKQTIWVNSPRK